MAKTKNKPAPAEPAPATPASRGNYKGVSFSLRDPVRTAAVKAADGDPLAAEEIVMKHVSQGMGAGIRDYLTGRR